MMNNIAFKEFRTIFTLLNVMFKLKPILSVKYDSMFAWNCSNSYQNKLHASFFFLSR